jgi:hypothetical protein
MSQIFLIVRHRLELRLVEIARGNSGLQIVEGRDVMRGGRLRVRSRDVIAMHANEARAVACLKAAQEISAALDEEVARARAAYDRAVRQRLKAQAALAEGRVRA